MRLVLPTLIAGALPLAAIHCVVNPPPPSGPMQMQPPPQQQGPAGTAQGTGGPPPGSHPQAPCIAPIDDEGGRTFQITQSTPGDPSVVGCADGQREAFGDVAAFPTIAGCIAEWNGKISLRAGGVGSACGDDL